MSTIAVHESKSGHAALLRSLIVVIVFLLAGAFSHVRAQDKSGGAAQASSPPRPPQTYTQEGVSVEFSMEPIAPRRGKTSELLAGTEATVRFRISDTSEGKGLSSLRPSVWIDRRESGLGPDPRECREKIQAFLQPSFSRRAVMDLNTYFILALNHEANISVLDPLSGFGGSKLYTLVGLRSPGEDWVLSADKKRLYVSMPLAGAVAVIDTPTWKVIANVDTGVKPTRIALQNDGKYLWVGNDAAEEAASGVTAIDTESLRVAAQLKTGAGHHEIALAADDSRAFITNKQDGTLSVIDVRTLTKVADIKVGGLPVAAAFSSLSKAIYVANEGEGTIAVVDGQRRQVLARIKAEPGLRALRIVPDGRFGFVVNPVTNRVYIFDISSSRLTHVVPVGPGADQIAFTGQFAYVRSTGSEFVLMIKLTDLDKGTEVAVTRFPAGQKAPKDSPVSSTADAVIPAPGDDAVLVANPADRMVYYYAEGMAAPMGNFQNYGRAPKALLILDNSLVETARGVYTTTIRLPDAGRYDVAFLLDSPRVVNCFDVTVAENPALPKETAVALKIEQLDPDATLRAGESYSLRFKVTDLTSKQPRADLVDMGVLVFLAPGIWQERAWAKPRGGGVYEMSFVPPQAGVYYVYFQCPSLGLRLNQTSPLTLQAIER